MLTVNGQRALALCFHEQLYRPSIAGLADVALAMRSVRRSNRCCAQPIGCGARVEFLGADEGSATASGCGRLRKVRNKVSAGRAIHENNLLF
jgi:hypothetical protein